MDTNALKKFAQSARNLLIDQVRSKLDLVLDPSSPARREHLQAMKELDAAIARDGKAQVIEQVAYTWFNRFTALRFMDANGYTTVGVVSPAEGQTRPEILAEAMAGNLPEGAPGSIAALLDGRTPSSDPQGEAYRQLLVHACNQWHGPMPFLFEELDDYTELLMPEDLLSQSSILAELRKVMTEDACGDVEIIGWLYQFYISEKKDQVFAGLKKNQKITAENIPAATQLFTPHWIVRYLVENSLGRLWLLNRPASRLAERMDYYIAPEEPETDFLKIIKPEDIRICDPAVGSGHMLTYAFDLLYAIYEEEGYDATEIPALILTHNLTGVEIDDRAGALAGFALAMKAAARLGRRRFLRMAAKPDICVLQNVSFTPAEMQDVAAVVGKDLFTDELRETLGQFEQAKNFGSLIVPKLRDPAETLRVVEARDFGDDLLLKEMQDRVIALLRMAEALSPKYHVVVANPPYMGNGGMNAKLKAMLASQYTASKADLMTAFIDRSQGITLKNGFISSVTLDAWMFLSSFEKFRTKLLNNSSLSQLTHIGWNCFPEGHTYNRGVAFVILNGRRNCTGDYINLADASATTDKGELFLTKIVKKELVSLGAQDFRSIPGTPIAYWLSGQLRSAFMSGKRINSIARAAKGLVTANNERFVRDWTEVNLNEITFGATSRDEAKESQNRWFPYAKGGPVRRWYGNLESVVNWQNDGYEIQTTLTDDGSRVRATNFNLDRIFRPGISWTVVTSSDLSFRMVGAGYLFDAAAGVCQADSPEANLGLLSFLNSTVAHKILESINPTINLHPGYLEALPINDAIERSAGARSVEVLVSFAKSDWDAYETSWGFTTLPLLSPAHRGETLADSYATLRAHWQSMTDEMKALEEENNRIFIHAYGLQDELTPEVPIEEITLTCNPAYRYGVKGTEEDREARLRADTMSEFLSYAVGCMFGRYSLDAPGLILANHGERLEDYLARLAEKGIPEPRFMPDADNVIPVLDGDWFADDITERFRLFLRVTFGEAHFQENLRYIEDALGKDIRKYFTKDFYADHVKRYKKRPIYWMFSSPKGTFNALIYMHRYRGDTVSVLLNDYLREFISKLEGERGRLEKLSDDPSASQGQRTKALKDMAIIAKQIDELNEWERDVVFPLAQAKIEINLDDGVKANYPKFGEALKKIPGLEAKDD